MPQPLGQSLSSSGPSAGGPNPQPPYPLSTPYPPQVPLFNNTEQSWAGPEKVSSEEETETGDRVIST